MNLSDAVKDYVRKMVDVTNGIKILLLDRDTTAIVSTVLTQSQLLERDVYLVNRIDDMSRAPMKQLKAICFLRPTLQSHADLIEELKKPRYKEYYIFFSNMVDRIYIEQLADADEYEVVKEVQEYYADYVVINSDLFTLNCPLSPEKDQRQRENDLLKRTTEGLSALLLSLKKRPIIRYEQNSQQAMQIAEELQHQVQLKSSQFDYRRPDAAALVLILDRRNDPVTPLLNQWTYQAMIHELIGLKNNRADLSSSPRVPSEHKDIVLSGEQDPFFRSSMFATFGDLGVSIKKYVDEYQTRVHSSKQIESIEELKKFVETLPDSQRMKGNVSKHVAMASELSFLVADRKLLELSELEQQISCVEDQTTHQKKLENILSRIDISEDNKLRLLLLYTLRYEKYAKATLPGMKQISHGISPQKLTMTDTILKYAGMSRRQGDLFSNQTLAKTVFSKIITPLKGVENIYTQHVPLLSSTIQIINQNELRATAYPFAGDVSNERPRDVILFMVGGTTFEEAKVVGQYNSIPNMPLRIILGSHIIHNSQSFLEDVRLST